jgi:hypothetical protein
MSGGQKRIHFREERELVRNPLREQLMVHGERDVMLIPEAAEPYVMRERPPHECFWYLTTQMTRPNAAAHEQKASRIHRAMEAIYAELQAAVAHYRESRKTSDDIWAFKAIVADVAGWACDVATDRATQYAMWTDRCSNNRGRMLELRAYVFLSLGLLQVAAALTDEPRGYTRYANNGVLAELVAIATSLAHPMSATKCDSLERWMENVELWLARDAEPKSGVSAYDLALRNTKRALFAAGPLSFYAARFDYAERDLGERWALYPEAAPTQTATPSTRPTSSSPTPVPTTHTFRVSRATAREADEIHARMGPRSTSVPTSAPRPRGYARGRGAHPF